MKVVCVRGRNNKNRITNAKNHGLYPTKLVIGGIYDAIDATANSYVVSKETLPLGVINGWWERKEDFITLEDHRQEQLNKLF